MLQCLTLRLVDRHRIGQVDRKLQPTKWNRWILQTSVQCHPRDKHHIVIPNCTQHTTLQDPSSRSDKPQPSAIVETMDGIQIPQQHQWCTILELLLVKGKPRGVECMQNFWLDIVIFSVSHRVCTEIGHLLLRCYGIKDGGVDVMNLNIPGSKDGAILSNTLNWAPCALAQESNHNPNMCCFRPWNPPVQAKLCSQGVAGHTHQEFECLYSHHSTKQPQQCSILFNHFKKQPQPWSISLFLQESNLNDQ